MSLPPISNTSVPVVTVHPANAGEIAISPPTFLERWGVVFVAWIGAWILLVGTAVVAYFLYKQPALPNLTGLTPDQVRDALSTHKAIAEQWRDALTYIFDLTVTKTALPVMTLLLGYLFGRTKSGA